MKLSDAVTNNTYIISSLNCNNNTDNMRISALGFVPGNKIKLLQNSPYKIYMVGTGRIAISDNIADMINIEK